MHHNQRQSLARLVVMVFSLSLFCLLNAGCNSFRVVYEKNTKTVADMWEGNFRDGKGFIPCNGSIQVRRWNGFFGVKSSDSYGFYFRIGVTSPGDFYFIMAENRPVLSDTPLKITEARGTVRLIDDRYIVLDVTYRDSRGIWRKLWLNGRHKIDSVLPDHSPPTPETLKS
jgi:hypothetical protein